MQLLALGMDQVQGYLAATNLVVAGDLSQLVVYISYTSAVQGLLQHHGGRLLAGGDPTTAMQLVAMLRGMAAAQQQVRPNPVPPQCLLHD